MPRKKRSRSTAAATEPEVEETTESGSEIEAEAESDAQSSSTGSSSRGPTLVWNRDRDHALVEAVSGGMTSAEVTAHLTSHEAFEDLDEGAVTPVKITNRLSLLRGRGVNVPSLTRAARYSPDVDELNDLLA